MKNKKYMILGLLLVVGVVDAGCGRWDYPCKARQKAREIKAAAQRAANAAREAAQRAANAAREAAEKAARAAKEAAEKVANEARKAAERAACLAKAGVSSAASLSKSLVGKAIAIDEFSLEIEVLKPTFKFQAKGAVAGKKFNISKEIERKGFDGDVQNLVAAQIAKVVDIAEGIDLSKVKL